MNLRKFKLKRRNSNLLPALPVKNLPITNIKEHEIESNKIKYYGNITSLLGSREDIC